MGGRGAASGLKYTKHKGYSSYGKKYGSEYQTVLQVGNIKFVKKNEGSTTPPVETRGGHERIYVTLTKKGNPKHITYYGRNGHRLKQIDLFGPSHTVDGKKVPTPHTHLGYMHLEGGTRSKLTSSERKMVENVNRLWKNRK